MVYVYIMRTSFNAVWNKETTPIVFYRISKHHCKDNYIFCEWGYKSAEKYKTQDQENNEENIKRTGLETTKTILI
jgi:agmatine/peptidylarginine deiminase